jgi:hypothetical protein
MANDPDDMKPETLAEILDATCGSQPTVLLLSACYSGIFLTPRIQRPNRIVLTAARRDRTSFGCDDNGDFSFWDECLLDHFREARTWHELNDVITGCITGLEMVGRKERSYPQAFFGDRVADLEIPTAGWWSTLAPARLYSLLWDEKNYSWNRREPPPDLTPVCVQWEGLPKVSTAY